jgi:predicted transcriptional regulator
MLPEGSKTGRIRLVPVKGSVPDVQAGGAPVGVYGAEVRRLFREGGLEPDYHFNAIECCLMEAVNGRDSVLFVDDSMKDRAAEVIGEMGKFGKRIEVVR